MAQGMTSRTVGVRPRLVIGAVGLTAAFAVIGFAVGALVATGKSPVAGQTATSVSAASVSKDAVGTATAPRAGVEIDMPSVGLTAAQRADADRWQGLADAFSPRAGLTAAQQAEADRWQGLADSVLGSVGLTAAQRAEADRWQGWANALMSGWCPIVSRSVPTGYFESSYLQFCG